LRRRRGTAILAVLGLAAGALSAAPTATAGHATITIQVGAQLGPRSLPAESMRFAGPETITVHQGDRITFDFRGFHTATLLPAGVGADEWLIENASPTGGFAFARTDPDDGPNEFKDNFPGVATPTDPTCGAAGQSPCTYNGDAVLNSGAPFELPHTFTATVNAAPGETFWVVCLVHHHMRKRIRVVADPAAATTQSAIDAAARDQLARDLDWAQATHAKYSDRRTSHETAAGRRVWDAWAGVDSRTVSLYAFYPKRLTIERGDLVRWRFDSLVLEDHTVSMPDPQLFFRLQFDEFQCDPDGDQGTAPDTAPDSDPQTGEPVCPEGSTLETDVSHAFWGGDGNGVLSGLQDLEHSGIRGVQAERLTPPAAGVDSFDVRFGARSGNRPFKYFCFLHPMEGFVTVQ
jgi:plastocyanin